MGRKKKHEEHVNHEAWAIPYADLLTLLLAFFVVMYAVSSLNEGKYRVMADALTTAFGGMPRTISQVQVGNQQVQGAANDTPSAINAQSMTGNRANDPAQLSAVGAQMRQPISFRDTASLESASRQLQTISERISRALAPLIDSGMITVRRTELWIEVEINSDILFAQASAQLDPVAQQTLGTLAEVLRDVPNTLRVEGHTDSLPIATPQFPSNWELSAARAASVVHLFADQGIAPNRLAMVGYGEFRPREDNNDPGGRNRNRRVMVVILADSASPVDALGEQLLNHQPAPVTLAQAGASHPPAAAASPQLPAMAALPARHANAAVTPSSPAIKQGQP
jgi:chemotaxis protein MotB